MAAQLQRLMDPTKGRSLMQINTALQRMGFCTWADLEPGMYMFSISLLLPITIFVISYQYILQAINYSISRRSSESRRFYSTTAK